MNQHCLSGMCCRDMILPSEADRFGLANDHACDPNRRDCGDPNISEIALEQWRECFDDDLLDFSKRQVIPPLPRCIPNLRARESAHDIKSHVLAVKATDIGGLRSRDSRRLASWRLKYGVDTHALLMIHQESRDPLIESLWRHMRDDSFYDELQRLGRLVLVSPGFSVYDDGTMCDLRQVLHMRLSLRLAARANQSGVPVIPTFGWNHHRKHDLKFLAEWCERQGDKLYSVAVNAQTGSLSVELQNLVQGMMFIEQKVGRSYEWIVFGGRQRIERITEFFPRNRIVQVARAENFDFLQREARVRSSSQPARRHFGCLNASAFESGLRP